MLTKGRRGAFIISYFTPTVGLGCRSGGYMIFVVLATFSFTVEMLVWWQVSVSTASSPAIPLLHRTSLPSRLDSFQESIVRRLLRSDSNSWGSGIKSAIVRNWEHFWELPFRTKVEYFILRPTDIVNTAWLMYIVLAQTFGWYRTCRCMSSVWGGGGGWIDFEDMDYYRAHGVVLYWASGTALSCTLLFVPVLFIVAEWCEQSHLSTENYDNASRGLRRTRSWKKWTMPFRDGPEWVIEVVKGLRRTLFGRKFRGGRRSLVWEYGVRGEGRRGGDWVAPAVFMGVPSEEEGDVGLLSGRKGGMAKNGMASEIRMENLSPLAALRSSERDGNGSGNGDGRGPSGSASGSEAVSPRASNEALSVQGSAVSAKETV
jgi:hypothetical protein